MTWALVSGLVVLACAHPALYARERAFPWVIGCLAACSLAVLAVERRAAPQGAPAHRHSCRGEPGGRRRILAASVVLFGAGSLLSFGMNQGASIAGLASPASGLFLLWLGLWLGADPRPVSTFTAAVLGAGALAAAYAVCQYLGWDPLPAATPFSDRTVSVFENPNHLGSFAAATMPLALGGFLCWSRRRPPTATRSEARPSRFPWRSGVWYPVVGLLYAALLLAGSRGAWVGAAAGVATLLWGTIRAHRRGVRWDPWKSLGMAFVISAVTAWLVPNRIMEGEHGPVTVGQRLLSAARATAPGTADDPTLNHRYFLWRVAWELILEKPVSGVGRGMFADRVTAVGGELGGSDRASTRVWVRDGARHAHNEYLNAWAEGGAFTLIGLVGMAACALSRLRPGARSCLHLSAAAGAVVAVLIHGLVSYPLHLPMTATLFWVLLGIMNNNAFPSPDLQE